MVTLCGTLVHSGRRWYLTSRETPPLPSAANSKTSNIRANFENLAKEKAQEDRRRAEAERAQRMAKERQEQEEARRQLDVSEGARGQAAGEEGAVKHRSPTASFEIPSSLHPWGVSQPPHTATQWRGAGGLRRAGSPCRQHPLRSSALYPVGQEGPRGPLWRPVPGLAPAGSTVLSPPPLVRWEAEVPQPGVPLLRALAGRNVLLG